MTVTHIDSHPQQRLMSALGDVFAAHPTLPEITGLAADTGEWTAQVINRGPEDVERLLQWIAVMEQPYVVARRRTASTELVADGLIGGARLRILMLSPRPPEEFGVPADAGSAIVLVEHLRAMVAASCGWCGERLAEDAVSRDFCGEQHQHLWFQARCDFEGEHLVQIPERVA